MLDWVKIIEKYLIGFNCINILNRKNYDRIIYTGDNEDNLLNLII
jgi:hypothetical protein